ncbi:hypothetical protein ScPMuIL_012012 [Solemya velum]
MAWFLYLLFVNLIQIWSSQVKADTFSAIFRIEMVLETETKLISHLEKLAADERSEGRFLSDDILEFLERASVENKLGRSDEDFPANPLNALRILRRYVHWWTRIPEMLQCEDCFISSHVLEYIESYDAITQNMAEVPSANDLKGVADGIYRLSKMYHLDLAELYGGKIKDTQTDPMDPEDVLLITDILESKDLYETEIVWLEKLIDRFRSGQWDHSLIEQRKFYKRLARTFFMAGQLTETIKIIQEYLDEVPDDEIMKKELEFYESKDDNEVERVVTRHKEFVYDAEIDENYLRLCNGEELRTPRQLAPLRCFSRETTIPYLRAKEEVLNYNPRIAMFHEVISHNETLVVREIAKARLIRSGLLNKDGSQFQDRIRISQTAWVDDLDHPIIDKLSRRIESLTGLSLTRKQRASDCEALQVLNYGVGGLYLPHWDYMLENNQQTEDLWGSGERIATWLFYLTDVKYGGSTVYPKLKVRVPVTKGSAAFWYNMKKNTDVDERTLHAACPVLVGSKWVCNKWIRVNGQFKTRPCGLTKDDTIHD